MIKNRLRFFKSFLIMAYLLIISLQGKGQLHITAQRLKGNPIISTDMIQGYDGENMNGPSLIKVPGWVQHPLGKYYLYFAHHQGKYIRMAYADQLEGPWKLYKPGVLKNSETVFGDGPDRELDLIGMKDKWVAHIASPDVLVDNEKKLFKMIFHGLGPKTNECHCTSIAISKDGLNFSMAENSPLIKESYLREFQYKGQYYFIGRLGKLFRSSNGLGPFEEGPNPFETINKEAALRHPDVLVRHDTLLVFYSRMGDKPERIVMSSIVLNEDWKTWKASAPLTVLEPETEYEGVKLELKASEPGNATARLRQLRDPYIYTENGKTYLLYSIQGESGIAIAELKIE